MFEWMVPKEIEEFINALPPACKKRKRRAQEKRYPSVREHQNKNKYVANRKRGIHTASWHSSNYNKTKKIAKNRKLKF